MIEKDHPVALITGGARRIGACIADYFHQQEYVVIVHYRHSVNDAHALIATLNKQRLNSAFAIQADFDHESAYEKLIHDTIKMTGRLDVFINNASTFTPTPIGNITPKNWDYVINSNFKAPLFLSQAAAPHLKKTQGNIINITDIHAETPMKNYSVYSCAKAGLRMVTQSLALELAPHIRVNAIAPGNVVWPEGENLYSEEKKRWILASTVLQKQVAPLNIAKTAFFLAQNTSMTGQTIVVDGGKMSMRMSVNDEDMITTHQ